MKNIIKKISVAVLAFMLMFGAIVNTNVKSIYADDNIITVKFTYVRADNRYSDFYMKAFLPSGSFDTNGPFMIIGDKAVFECKLQKDVDIDEIISFRVMEKTIGEAVIKGEIDISTINSGTIDVVINGDSGATTITGTSGSSEMTNPETPSVEPETPSAGTETPDEPATEPQQDAPVEPDIAYTEKLDVGDDPNKDYSMKPAMVVVCDVLFLAGLGVAVFFVLSKKKNAFM
ncbi:MAG: hypothetical protein IJA34_04105 [Lachnospiraceae bacterium]|nr:hypothetical protein [Lachnospiraceae bacterium]